MIALASDYTDPATAPANALPSERGRAVVEGRHREYVEFLNTWRWLLDSLEGGKRYREAEYGMMPHSVAYEVRDPETGREYTRHRQHVLPRRNLIRHPQEFPSAADAISDVKDDPSTADEYGFRLSLTPVPSFVPEAITAHLARIYAREVRREAPEGPAGDALREWWADVDGAGTAVDDWMQETIAPTFLALGQIDLAFDHPPAPSGVAIESQADVERLDLTRVVASYILPENLTNWRLAPDKSYAWAVVREWGDDGQERYREWTTTGSILYDCRGRQVGKPTPHGYGRVPIHRGFDTKKLRCDNVGQPRYESIAEIQRTYYNVDSELSLSNSLAAHALLSGPEEYCSGSSVAIGPGNVLPMKRVQGTAGGTAYQGWAYVCPPNDAADKLRNKLDDLRDAADRAACLTKPAGASGTGKGTVGQSGVSKMLDQSSGNDLLSKVSKALRQLELKAVALFLTVKNGKPPDPAFLEKVKVAYPTKFDLFTATDFSTLVAEWQALVQGVDGELPEMAGHLFRTWVRLVLSGLDDETYEKIDEEIDAFLAARKAQADRLAEAGPMVPGATGAGGAAQQPWPYAKSNMLSEEVPTT